jgi:hypothetical protein
MLTPINQIGKCAPNFSVNRCVLDKVNKKELSEIDICDLFIHDLKARIAFSSSDSAICTTNQNNACPLEL